MKTNKTLTKLNTRQLAIDIISFLQKWGMWKDTMIFTGGRMYSHSREETDCVSGLSYTKEEPCTDKDMINYTKGLVEKSDGSYEWKNFSNPDRLLDMVFEGPLSLLLFHHEYEVDLEDVSKEAIDFMLQEYRIYFEDGLDSSTLFEHEEYEEYKEHEEEINEMFESYMERKSGWDPMIHDSYEEYLEMNQYCEPEDDAPLNEKKDFATREEYMDYLEMTISRKENCIAEWAGLEPEKEMVYDGHFYQDETSPISGYLLKEFSDILEKHGLWYELGFSWSLTAYPIDEE